MSKSPSKWGSKSLLRGVSSVVAAALLLAGLAAPRALAGDRPDWLVGTWTGKIGEKAIVLELRGDGKAVLTGTSPEGTATERGTWSITEDGLHLVGDDGEASAYELAKGEGDPPATFSLSGEDLGEDAVVFTRRAGGTAPAPAKPAAAPAYDGPLVGRWIHNGQFQTTTIVFLPDGRYGWETRVGASPVFTHGKFRVDGSTIVFAPQSGGETRNDASLEGGVLTLSGGALGAVALAFEKVPGSEKAVVEQAKADDEAKAKEDEGWRARFPVARMEEQPPHVPVGEVPADPRVKRVFEEPIVFTGPQIYVWQSSHAWVLDVTTGTLARARSMGGGTLHDTTHWHFLPTGRFFVRSVNYRLGGDPNAPEVKETWGRYAFAEGDAIRADTDAGEDLALEFIDGRRNLMFGTTRYGNVVWEKEALDQALRK